MFYRKRHYTKRYVRHVTTLKNFMTSNIVYCNIIHIFCKNKSNLLEI